MPTQAATPRSIEECPPIERAAVLILRDALKVHAGRTELYYWATRVATEPGFTGSLDWATADRIASGRFTVYDGVQRPSSRLNETDNAIRLLASAVTLFRHEGRPDVDPTDEHVGNWGPSSLVTAIAHYIKGITNAYAGEIQDLRNR